MSEVDDWIVATRMADLFDRGYPPSIKEEEPFHLLEKATANSPFLYPVLERLSPLTCSRKTRPRGSL